MMLTLIFYAGMNEHIPERFKGARCRTTDGPSSNFGHVNVQLQDSVTQYVNRALPAQEAHTWCTIEELPTSAEILSPIGNASYDQSRDGESSTHTRFMHQLIHAKMISHPPASSLARTTTTTFSLVLRKQTRCGVPGRQRKNT